MNPLHGSAPTTVAALERREPYQPHPILGHEQPRPGDLL